MTRLRDFEERLRSQQEQFYQSLRETQAQEEERRQRLEVERELARIRAATVELRRTEGDHEAKLKAIEAERERLRDLEREVKQRERANREAMLRAEVEREHLKSLSTLIELQEQHRPPRPPPLVSEGNHHHNHISCTDCGMSQEKAAEKSEEPPVFKLESVVDWLDHRRHHARQHQAKVRATYEKAIEKLDKAREEREKRSQDWATNKLDRLGKLLKAKEIFS